MSRQAKTVSVAEIASRKGSGRRLTMLTAYDALTARLLDSIDILDMILVGDSVGTTLLGLPDTTGVTMDDIVHHTRAVRRGVKRALVVADMPFLSYQASDEQAMLNAARLIREGGAQSVKIEGGSEIVPVVRKLTDAGIPVVGHIGLRPQSVHLTGLKVQGRTGAEAERVEADALALQDAGAYAVVLELLPRELAARITSAIAIPTIGIGSGPDCDGQVLVIADLLGLSPERAPFRHVKQYAQVGKAIADAARAYCDDVQDGRFPGSENSV
jgi:3-methyl-2-oxobutanoate hydroxymethyltransferase